MTEYIDLTVEEIVSRTVATYEDISPEWERHTLNDMPVVRVVRGLDWLAKSLPAIPTRKVLELGCGFAQHRSFFTHRGISYTGIDASSAIIERAIALNDGNGQFLQRDFHKLEVLDLFDGFFALRCFQHIVKGHMPGVLQRLRRNLKNGALGYLVVYRGDGEKFIHPVGYESTHQAYVAGYTQGELFRHFQTAGFDICDYDFDGEDEIHYLKVQAL